MCPFPIFGLEILSLASGDNCNDIKLYYIDESLTEVFKKLNNANVTNYFTNIYHFKGKNSNTFDIIIDNYINFHGEISINSIENQICTK